MSHDETRAVNGMFADICSFHMKFLLHPYENFAAMPTELVVFREKFLTEEATETYESMAKKDHAGVLDGLVDLAYVALGTLYMMGVTEHDLTTSTHSVKLLQIVILTDGIVLTSESKQYLIDLTHCCRQLAYSFDWNFDEAWRLVHEANMKKIRVERAEDSKRGSTFDVKKPEGWIAPDLSHLV